MLANKQTNRNRLKAKKILKQNTLKMKKKFNSLKIVLT